MSADPQGRYTLPTPFRLARNVSKHSHHRIKMGAVLIKNGHPIAVGFNKLKYNKLWSNRWARSIHAECTALKTCGKEDVRGSVMYVYREFSTGLPALARPCTHCQMVMKSKGIKTVFFSTSIFPFWERLEL